MSNEVTPGVSFTTPTETLYAQRGLRSQFIGSFSTGCSPTVGILVNLDDVAAPVPHVRGTAAPSLHSFDVKLAFHASRSLFRFSSLSLSLSLPRSSRDKFAVAFTGRFRPTNQVARFPTQSEIHMSR